MISNDIYFNNKKRLQNRVFWTTKVLGYQKYLEVLFGKFGTYKSKNTLKPLLSQNMVHFT